jgi:predicted ATPase
LQQCRKLASAAGAELSPSYWLNLARVEIKAGNLAAAHAALVEARARLERRPERLTLLSLEEVQAEHALAARDFEQGSRLAQAAAAVRQEIGAPRSWWTTEALERLEG